MPKYGDKMYRVSHDGTLEVTTFIEKGACDTYILWSERTNSSGIRRRIQCSVGMYLDTEKAAWKRYRQECLNAVASHKIQQEETQCRIDHCESEVTRVENILRGKERMER